MSLRRAIERRAAFALQRLPESILARLAGSPDVKDGQRLDARLQFLMRVQNLRKRPSLETLSPEGARDEYRQSVTLLDEPSLGLEITEEQAGDIPVRVYRPSGPLAGVLVYLHGGGGVIGDIATADSPARLIAHAARVAVVSADYRLGPEHPYPAALEDTLAVYRWTVDQAERIGAPARFALGGDSYGGALAALAALDLRADPQPPHAQLLIYPCTDFLREGGSRDLFTQGYLLDKPLIGWFRDLAFSSLEDRGQGSVMRREDIAGVAPAIICTAGFDPLRDEGKDYADRLREAGVPVTYRCEEGLVHAFISMTTVVPAARAAVIGLAEALAKQLDVG